MDKKQLKLIDELEQLEVRISTPDASTSSFEPDDYFKNRETHKKWVLISLLVLAFTSYAFPIFLFIADFLGKIELDDLHIALLTVGFFIQPFIIIDKIATKPVE